MRVMSALLRLVKINALQKARDLASSCLREVRLIVVIWKAYYLVLGRRFKLLSLANAWKILVNNGVIY